eukprot:16429706-Heterocapsa_arctica.AAC.1
MVTLGRKLMGAREIHIDGSEGKSAGPLIVIPGGSAQMADRLNEAEKTWRIMGCRSRGST